MKKILLSLALLSAAMLSTRPSFAFGHELLDEPLAIIADQQASLEQTAKNSTYELLVAKRSITLKNGVFKAGDNPDNFIEARLVRSVICDLNKDNKPDIAVIIEHHGMGSAGFFELSALLSGAKGFTQTRPVLLGENIEIKEFSVSSNMWRPEELDIVYLGHQESDSHANPTEQKRARYFLDDDGQLSNDFSHIQIVKKPALYLYPVRTTKIEVRLSPKGKVIRTIPDYNNRWRVTVQKDGMIDGQYHYLFYEAALDKKIELPRRGWSVRYGDLAGWFDSHLHEMGLNRAEAEDLKEYWLKNLPDSPYYTIRLIEPDVVNKRLGLKIHPKPDSELRVLLNFTPTEKPEKIKAPKLTSFRRKGFTAVEWGGILDDGRMAENVH
ncbi:MAG TPA: hypothetical protein DEB17_09225 [Chlorobaculum sp.]|jgi:hypothetical protein|uniref:Uncharacterized protein n=1 Tax=Chlorobaculum tepidum (strain ATCC 49652 / DSM 12025 / NBRC 103806 / TLS) TaxID=194439 RepID=Q8KB89_CHLTE|nr:hypothetical protein [Chlorobaculum tepidum]AAM73119.1 hypothetical protein CT1900 [Chlorobaculum tepidum TLS]HBU24148.1 hypothetical protein [Chlorobaculum sp.]